MNPEEVLIRTDLPSLEWDTYVRSRRDAGNFYQLSGWRDVVGGAFGHKTHFLSAHRDAQTVGIFPIVEIKHPLFGHSLISTAFCVGGAPLADDAEALAALATKAQAVVAETGAKYLEVRDLPDLDNGFQPASQTHSSFERPIEASEDDCLKQIPRKQRAVVRKALKSDLHFTVDRDLETFYRLHAYTFRGHGTPVFPKRYYQALLDVFQEDCDILTVWQGSTALSSVMTFYFEHRATPYYMGSIPEARPTGANDLMYWQLMREAVGRGYTSFDFGRSKLNSGPYSFKKNWGFDPRPVTNWFYLSDGGELPNMNPSNPKFKLAIEAWKRLPVPVANFVARFLSPGIG